MGAPTPGELRAQVLVIGSGAGGAVTAATLAEAGYDVLLVEEGPDLDSASLASNSAEAIARLYRHGGMTPILGNQNIAFVEGRCLGGSTEVNSGFWHRLSPDCYPRWTTDALLDAFTPESLEPHFERLERDLRVSTPSPQRESPSSAVLRRGAERLGWSVAPVPRCQSDPDASPFAPGAKQSMQRTYLPRARAAGARVVSDCQVLRVLHEGSRALGAEALVTEQGRRVRRRLRADVVILCGGAVQTPALLRRSGVRRHVGDNLCIHPMLKLAARFDEDMDAQDANLPIYQVREFSPTITLGGSVFTPGFLAMLLADSWQATRHAMRDWRRSALYYVATRGMSRGSVRVLPGLRDGVLVRYRLTPADERNLSLGLARLGELLFAAGARELHPALRSRPVLRSPDELRGFLERPIPATDMALSTVHAFSTCPMGENPDFCATDSFGRVVGFANLFVNDASLIPDSPGVNPQGTTMAIALRNVEHFLEGAQREAALRPRRGAARPRPAVLVTGAPGWLGSRLVELLAAQAPEARPLLREGAGETLRCLVLPGADATALAQAGARVELQPGDLRDAASLEDLCEGAEGATLFHVAGVIHPRWRTRDFEAVNVRGTQRLLEAARRAGVRRVVAVSSNSPLGFNAGADDLFDERSPLAPYQGYGRSKAALERLVREACQGGGLEGVIVRAPWFYGPHQPERQSAFFRMIRRGLFPILGDGRQRRSLAYLDDLCQGLLLAASAPRANGEIYWIADERPYTILEIVETVESVLEAELGTPCARRRLRLPALVGAAARLGDSALQRLGLYQAQLHVLGELDRSIACSIAKAKAELGYAPRFSLREGMTQSVRWCLSRGIRL